MGNSFAQGQAMGNGNSHANGPGAAELAQGWDIRPWAHWDYTEGRAYL